MFTLQDLDEAVADGAVTPDAADRLRAHLEARRASPSVDEEQFRLLTGFNDIFVSIAAVILLFSVGFIGAKIGTGFGPRDVFGMSAAPFALAGLVVAATAWGLALFFTARRRMALPSIVLLLAFVSGLFVAGSMAMTMVLQPADSASDQTQVSIVLAVGAALAVAGAWLHWRRFKVPITIAAGAAALAAFAMSLVTSAIPVNDAKDTIVLIVILLLGIATFLFAMRWDSSDPQRTTRRSDVAFWLHLLAAPMIVHPVFALLGLTSGTASIGEGLVVVGLYVVLGVTALAIDRRALLVSALAYVLYALSSLFREFGAVELNVALTALVIGSALLLLSAFWHHARRRVVEALPAGLRGYLPTLDRVSPLPAA